jgi:hypothetical protein
VSVWLLNFVTPYNCLSFIAVSSRDSPKFSHIVPDLTKQLARASQFSVASGGFADVWIAKWTTDEVEHKVAVKVLRSSSNNPTVEAKIERVSRLV